MSNEPRECRYCYGTGIDTTDSVCACVRYPLETERKPSWFATWLKKRKEAMNHHRPITHEPKPVPVSQREVMETAQALRAQLELVKKNLEIGMSKSIQRLQARSIKEVLDDLPRL
jgi:hypothetical protein